MPSLTAPSVDPSVTPSVASPDARPVALPRRRGTARRFGIPVVLIALILAGCTTIPRDPDGTLDRIRETSVLRAGASPGGRWVRIDGDRVTGVEPDLVSGFATSLGASVSWRTGGEEELVTAMEEGELDVLVGGLTAQSPWSEKVSITRPYAESTARGEKVDHVMAVPLGENALLDRLERYLDEEAS